MRRRLILGSLYLLLVVVIGLVLPFGATLDRRLTDELGGRVEREAYTVGAAVEDRLESGDRLGLQPLAESFARQVGDALGAAGLKVTKTPLADFRRAKTGRFAPAETTGAGRAA